MSSPESVSGTHISLDKDFHAEVATLDDTLDALWTGYLTHLDAYQAAQKDLQAQLSSAFFLLAQANRSASAGRRYGRDWYDDRMKASRRVRLSGRESAAEGEGVERARLEMRIVHAELPAAVRGGGGASGEGDEEPKQQPSPPATPTTEDEEKAASDVPSATAEAPADAPKARDPINWYGILLPPALRQAQTSFSAAVDVSVAKAVDASRAMRETEVEVRRVRKAVGKLERDLGRRKVG